MDERMTICNMSIEGGARVGYVNPDETTFDYLRGRPFAPAGRGLRRARRRGGVASRRIRTPSTTTTWRSTRERVDADRDLGHQPGQSVGVDERLPRAGDAPAPTRRRSPKRSSSWACAAGAADRRARRSTSRSSARAPTAGCPICARPRAIVRGPARRAAREGAGRARLAGGQRGGRARRARPRSSREAGFEWRGAGCSMCLAMNPDRLEGDEVCAVVVEPQFQGPAGQPDRPHAADEPGDGRRRRGRRRGGRRQGARRGMAH